MQVDKSATRTTETGGVSSRLCRDLDYPRLEKTSVSCCLHLWDKARGKRIGSYMSCLLSLCNMKQATLKQNWSKCGCCFTARINDGLAEKPRYTQEEQSLRCSHRDTSSVIDARHLARQPLSWICELAVGQAL